MDKAQRLLIFLKERKFVKTEEIMAHLNISAASARRLINQTKDQPHVQRFHGGLRYDHLNLSFPLSELEQTKKNIAAYTAKHYIKDNQTIFISSGMTPSYLKDFLSPFSNLTVVTSNLMIVPTIMELDHIELILTGGIVTRDVPALYGGFFPIELLTQKIAIDTCFLTSTHVDERGCSAPNTLEIQDLQRIMSLPSQKYLLADHTKIGTYKPYIWGRLSEFATLITDKNTESIEKLRAFIDISIADMG